ncbi:MAG: right-handed parallel beta-helix repeat-containing protein, partial [Saprospiraceae bacterium]|nr:right-handed parallel beta-helix repeat-containing protein [Saprospiraceae bacterium]
MLFRGILIALGLFCVSSGLCTTYFVSPAGNDANSGTSPGAAFATIQHASDIVVAGDSVIVLAGAYTGFNVATSGTSLNPIVFLGEPGAEITAPTFTMDGINVEGADYIEINGFVVNDQPRNGIRLVNADWCIVRNCTCDNNFERGIFTGFTDDILIENNVCSNSIDEHGIYVSNSSDRSVIRFNTCFGNNRGGIQINADLSQGGDGISTDPEIYGNVLFSNGLGGGAAINLDGVQGAFIYNNVLYNNHATGIALFQQDGGGPSVNAQIVHNTIVQAVDGRWCILLVDGASGAQIYNNILFNQHPWRGSIAADPDATPGLTSDYNLVVDSFSDMGDGVSIPLSDWQALGYDLNSALADPLALLFVDPASGDFHLLPGSQAVDNGNGLLALGVTTDIDGNLRP